MSLARSRAVLPSLLGAGLIASALALSGCSECSFIERCQGSIREVCGANEEQRFGREVSTYPCRAPNDVCLEAEEDLTGCVYDPPTRCEVASFEARCGDDGTTALRCEQMTSAFGVRSTDAYVVAEDCAARGELCGVRDGFARCVPEA